MGGGGGGAAGDVDLFMPNALRAAWDARDWAPFELLEGGIEGGGGGVDLAGGGRGAEDGGTGGAEGGADACVDNEEGFLDAGGGSGGFLPIGGAGLGFEERSKEDTEASDDGRKLFLKFATDGNAGAEPGGSGGADPGSLGALPPGGGGACPMGGLGAEFLDVSGSERYGDLLSESLPVSTPPAFLSFGIPPAKRPASCGGALKLSPPLSPPSLLLLALLGVGGASPGGGGAMPGA